MLRDVNHVNSSAPVDLLTGIWEYMSFWAAIMTLEDFALTGFAEE